MSDTSARYARQVCLPGFGAAGQRTLDRSHVAVIGAGGLGSPALLYLAAAGVGRLTIIDDDTVELSNLHRQVVHGTSHLGEPKVDSARAMLADINPTVEVEVVRGRLLWPSAPDILRGADIVLDGADNFETRHVVSAACAQLGIPHVWAAILGWEAQLSVFHAGHGPIYEDLFPSPPAPGTVPNCAQAGVLGPVVGVVGSAMAGEAIKYLTGCGQLLLGRVALYDAWTFSWREIPLHGDPAVAERIRAEGPPIEAQVPEVASIPPGALLLDVREPHEYASGHIPGATNVPLSAIEADPASTWASIPHDGERQIVLYCQAGVRSQGAWRLLRPVWGAHDVDVTSLNGGYERWLHSDQSSAHPR